MTSGLGKRLGIAALAALLATAACSSSDDDGDAAGDTDEASTDTEQVAAEEEAVYPGADWERGDPAEQGFDPAELERIAAEAEAENSHCLVVVRHGQIAGEWYFDGTTADTSQEVYSATKSYTSTLVGIAQAEGLLDIDDKASEYLTEWVGTPSEDVTIRNLLSNNSGRHWDFQTDYLALSGQHDRDAFAIGLSQDAPPGDTWVYNNAAIQTLDAVPQRATGMPTADYAQEKLFGPLGMTHSAMSEDGAGNAAVYFGLESTCLDMARFGYLFLRNGEWDGDEVVPAEWVEEATQPSQEINTGYGYLWWLNQPGKQINGVTGAVTLEEAEAAPERERPPGAPDDMYWAQGLGGQTIQVDPGSDTVVVRLGTGDVGASYGSWQTAEVVTEALVE